MPPLISLLSFYLSWVEERSLAVQTACFYWPAVLVVAGTLSLLGLSVVTIGDWLALKFR